MTYYYIINNAGSSRNDLPVGARVFKIDCHPTSLIPIFGNSDGPFLTLEELRKESKIFKELQKENPQRAQKIFDERFIVKVADKILVNKNIEEQFDNTLFHMLAHVVSGKVTKDNVSGVHYFDNRFHRIVEITKEKNDKGIWEARIEAIRPQKNDWIKKERPSTFFPVEWSKELLVLKFYEAFKNKKELTDTKYVGITDCGIEIVFIIENKKIISIYPIYD